jgi:uncharacterized damage-inducible protein DinB
MGETMERKENLRYLFESNHSAVRRLLDDITEDESMVCGKDNISHIRWQTGHMVYSAALTLKMLHDTADIPELWHTLFGRGSTISDNADEYPSLKELRDKLYDLYDQMEKRLDTITDEDFDKQAIIAPGFEPTSCNGTLFFCTHEFYHAGQIAIIRKVLGRDRAFG